MKKPEKNSAVLFLSNIFFGCKRTVIFLFLSLQPWVHTILNSDCCDLGVWKSRLKEEHALSRWVSLVQNRRKNCNIRIAISTWVPILYPSHCTNRHFATCLSHYMSLFLSLSLSAVFSFVVTLANQICMQLARNCQRGVHAADQLSQLTYVKCTVRRWWESGEIWERPR